MVILIDIFEYNEQAEEEIEISTSFTALILWIIVCLPLNFLGASAAMVGSENDLGHVAPNAIPRTVPASQPWYLNMHLANLISGAIIFSSFFVVLKYLWRSIWRSEAHVMILYMALYTVLTSIVIGELSIIFTFLRLRSGDYNWQWKAWTLGASSSLYIGAFILYYMAHHLALRLIADDCVYLLWALMFILPYTLYAGGISVLASGKFVSAIYKKN